MEIPKGEQLTVMSLASKSEYWHDEIGSVQITYDFFRTFEGQEVDGYPQAKWQRCVVHFYRNVFTAVPRGKVPIPTATSCLSTRSRTAATCKP